MAPDAELYIATVNTASDLWAAVDWFAANGVTIVTRSLGSGYDGPGDGTGPLDAVADHAVAPGVANSPFELPRSDFCNFTCLLWKA